MSIRQVITDKEDLGISYDKKELEVLYNSDEQGNYYLDIPISFIKEILFEKNDNETSLEYRIIKQSQLVVDAVNTNEEMFQAVSLYDAIHIAKQYAIEMCKKQREICTELVCYKGAISKVEAWSMKADELQEKCEELCKNAPLATEVE